MHIDPCMHDTDSLKAILKNGHWFIPQDFPLLIPRPETPTMQYHKPNYRVTSRDR